MNLNRPSATADSLPISWVTLHNYLTQRLRGTIMEACAVITLLEEHMLRPSVCQTRSTQQGKVWNSGGLGYTTAVYKEFVRISGFTALEVSFISEICWFATERENREFSVATINPIIQFVNPVFKPRLKGQFFFPTATQQQQQQQQQQQRHSKAFALSFGVYHTLQRQRNMYNNW